MLNLTKYYDEYLKYFQIAKWQHVNSNLGNIPHENTPYDDDLMKHVKIYDVVERKYAGFTKFLLDLWYSGSKREQHPYIHKMKIVKNGH
jgi:hypothetical protein